MFIYFIYVLVNLCYRSTFQFKKKIVIFSIAFSYLFDTFRLTVDKIINQDEHPIPKEDLTAKLAVGAKFSSIDFTHSYNKLQLDDESKDLTLILIVVYLDT